MRQAILSAVTLSIRTLIFLFEWVILPHLLEVLMHHMACHERCTYLFTRQTSYQKREIKRYLDPAKQCWCSRDVSRTSVCCPEAVPISSSTIVSRAKSELPSISCSTVLKLILYLLLPLVWHHECKQYLSFVQIISSNIVTLPSTNWTGACWSMLCGGEDNKNSTVSLF